MLQPTGPNAEQIKYWNEISGPKWVALHDRISVQIRPLGLRALERARIVAGEHALDVGCGCGETTMEIARRVGSAGRVTGIDLAAVMLERARTAAAACGLGWVHFENADAQTHRFPPGAFDLCFSRFGVMFFSDPSAAFANIGTALRSAGRIVFLCWQSLRDNPWAMVPLTAAAQYIALPQPPSPNAPGPFSLANPDRVQCILTEAGFRDVTVEPLCESLILAGGADLNTTVDFLMQMGPLAAALRRADPDAGTCARIADAVREALAPFAAPEGVRLASAAWLVCGRRS